MPKNNVLDVILRTITDVQQKNQNNPREETAHPNVFDLIKDKLGQLDNDIQNKQTQKGKKPVSILDLIKGQIEAARKHNVEDPNTPTAPDSIFKNITKKVDQRTQRVANAGVRRIIDEYNLDVSRLSRQALVQIQQQYNNELRMLNDKYAQGIHNLIQRS